MHQKPGSGFGGVRGGEGLNKKVQPGPELEEVVWGLQVGALADVHGAPLI